MFDSAQISLFTFSIYFNPGQGLDQVFIKSQPHLDQNYKIFITKKKCNSVIKYFKLVLRGLINILLGEAKPMVGHFQIFSIRGGRLCPIIKQLFITSKFSVI
jgi:hypothetical protein